MKKTECVLLIISTLIIYLAVLCFYIASRGEAVLPKTIDEHTVSVQDAVLISDGQEESIKLPSYFDVVGETRLICTLDYAFEGLTSPSLILQANHSFMTILLNGETIYQVKPLPYSIGNYFTHIPLPREARSAQLEIIITVPENGLTHISMPDLIIANEAVFLRQQVLRDIPSLLLNTLILFSGLTLFVLAIVTRKKINPYRVLLRGLFAINCGVYFMCETYCVVYLASSARMVYIADMLSFALLGPTLMILLGWELDGRRGKLLKLLAVVGTASVVLQLGAFLFGGVELRRLLPITHSIQAIGILAIIACIVYGLIRKKSNRGLYFGGLIALGGGADLILFLCEVGEHNVLFLKIAIVIYLFAQMYQFVRLLMAQSAEKARETYYKVLALKDSLSSCYSRAAFELDKNAWAGDAMRTVFFLDLNNLKLTNDQYGHSAGDKLIHGLGDILTGVFSSLGKCYRVGGDEFWVFCDNLRVGQTSEITRALALAVDAFNLESSLQIKLSYAIGVCDTLETEGDLKRAIELADMRMYENKLAIKQSV